MIRLFKVLAFAAGLTAAVAHAEDYSSMLLKGEAELQSGQYEDARKTLDDAIRASADNGRAWHLYGRAEMLLGNHDAALTAFDKAKEKGQKVSLDVGSVQYQKGDNRAALETLATAVEEDDANAEAHYMYGLALYKAERHKTAREHLARARELDPELEPEALVFSAAAASKLGDDETARKELETAAAIDPDGEAGKAAKKALAQGQGGKQGPFQAAVQLSTQYDSNVLLVPEAGGLFTPEEISNKSGNRLVLNLQGAWTPEITGSWRGVVGYGLYQSLHYTHRDTVKSFDLTNHGITLGAEQKSEAAALSLPYNLSLAYLNTFDKNTRYATTHSFTPSYAWKTGAHTLGAANAIGYEDYALDPVALELDGKDIAQTRDNLFDQLTVFYRLDAGKVYLTPSLALLYANASGDSSWDNTGGRVALQGGVAVTKTVGIDAGLSYTGRSYGNPFAVTDDAGVTTAEDRSDSETGFNLGLNYVNGHFNAFTGYSYTGNTSTIDTFQFRRHIVTLGAGAQF